MAELCTSCVLEVHYCINGSLIVIQLNWDAVYEWKSGTHAVTWIENTPDDPSTARKWHLIEARASNGVGCATAVLLKSVFLLILIDLLISVCVDILHLAQNIRNSHTCVYWLLSDTKRNRCWLFWVFYSAMWCHAFTMPIDSYWRHLWAQHSLWLVIHQHGGSPVNAL